jgi:hypothetical protein
MAVPNRIVWPNRYEPANCPVHVRNELAMTSKPEIVWEWLIRAKLWPTWYPNSANVQFLSGEPSDLGLNTRFRWRTFGVTLESTVLEFVPFERLGWDAHGRGFDGYHAWLITKTSEGCNVVTEETQRGFAARLQKVLAPKRMEKQHQIWLQNLSDNAAKGPPADSP